MPDGEQSGPAAPPPVSASLPSPASPRSKWSARLLSTICPGLGQLISGRWASGLLQMGVFLTALVSAGLMLIGQLFLAYRIAFSLDSHPQAEFPDLGGAHFVLPFVSSIAVALLVAAWSIWDAGKEPGTDSRT